MVAGHLTVAEVKVSIFLLSFAVALFGIALPKYAGFHGTDKNAFILFGNALASGVLLSAGLVHMLPDAESALHEVTNFPLGPTLAGGMFCVLVIIEDFAMSAASKKTQSPKSPHSYEARKDTTIQSHIIEDGWCPWLLGRLSNRGQPRCRGAKETCATSSLLGKNPRPMMWLPLWQVTNLLRRMAGLSPRGRNVPGSYPYESECPGSGCVTCDGCREELDESSPSCHADEHAHAHDQSHEGDSSVHLHAHGAGALASRKMSLVKAACLFSALCFHSVAEGMGLGSATHAPMVVSLAAAILVHKGLAAFALGAALCHDPELSMTRFCVLAIIFSVSTPFGGILGWSLSQNFGGVAVGICTACAAGTFLQVATLELIPASLAAPAEGRRKRCATIGFGFMMFSTLAKWV